MLIIFLKPHSEVNSTLRLISSISFFLAVIMEKFKDIRETSVVQIANVKMQEHRSSSQD